MCYRIRPELNWEKLYWRSRIFVDALNINDATRWYKMQKVVMIPKIGIHYNVRHSVESKSFVQSSQANSSEIMAL